MTANIKAWCLSLPRSIERRRQFDAEAARVGLVFEYVDGPDAGRADGGGLSRLADQVAAEMLTGRRLSQSEIACAEGHLRIYRLFLDSDAQAALVLEDDARLAEDFREVLKGLAGLGTVFLRRRLVLLLNGQKSDEGCPIWVRRGRRMPVLGKQSLFDVVQCFNAPWGSYGYMITRSAAAAVLNAQRQIGVPADWWRLFWKSGVLEGIWILDPPAVFHPLNNNDSLIERERAHMVARARTEYQGGSRLRTLACVIRNHPRWWQLRGWTYDVFLRRLP